MTTSCKSKNKIDFQTKKKNASCKTTQKIITNITRKKYKSSKIRKLFFILKVRKTFMLKPPPVVDNTIEKKLYNLFFFSNAG